METLLGLFEAAGWVNEVLSRTEEKDQELCHLSVSVQSVTQSIRAWSETMPEEDRNDLFNSNQVFPHLANVLKNCKQVLQRYQKPALESGAAAIQDSKGANGFRGVLSEKMKQGSRTLNEGLEALSSKMGSFGSGLLRLPEDELSKVKEANDSIQRLLPTLNLAIQVNGIRGSKRSPDTMLVSQAQRQRTSIENGSTDHVVTRSESGSTEQQGHEVPLPPLVNLRLMSDAPFAPKELGTLTTRDLRPSSANQSSTSLESADGSSPEKGDDHAKPAELVLGRIDLQKKVSFTFPSRETRRKAVPILQFVSRDFLQLEVLDANLAPTQGSMEMATLAWGSWNDTQDDEKPPLANASGMKDGFHVRKGGETRWRWTQKGVKAAIEEGDLIAIVLESPPGSETPAPQRDLDAEEVRCILGCELRKPDQ